MAEECEPLTSGAHGGARARVDDRGREKSLLRHATKHVLLDQVRWVSEVDPVTMVPYRWMGLDRTLDLCHRFDIYSPEVRPD